MKIKNFKPIIITSILMILVFIGLSLDSSKVLAANNDTLIVRVNVSNSAPTIYNVVIADTPIDLNAGTIKIVNCTGEVYDLNGWDDIAIANASIYDTTHGYSTNLATQDDNYRYFNNSCNCTEIDTENASCQCFFNVEYFANNGTWQCNMTVADNYGLASSRNSSEFTINPLIAIEVPTEIGYGNLSVTETSSQIPVNVSNYGNIQLNVSVRGWGGIDQYTSDLNDTALICATNNISMEYHRYSINISDTFNQMTNISNTSTQIPDFYIYQRENDAAPGNDTNTTYWRLQIPSNVAGSCNGTVEFSAIES